MVHEIVDARRWIGRYPLDAHFASLEAEGAPEFHYFAPDGVFSPRDFAITEQMRERAGVLRGEGGVPADVLLPALGEPVRRCVSKIGGLPYRPRGAWPVDAKGQALRFYAQMCFADSMDVLPADVRGALPGDVLLFFGADHDDVWDGWIAEWQRVGMEDSELVRAEEVPESPWTPTYFQRHRTVETPGEGLLAHGGLEIEVSGRLAASKIGGLPVWWQDESEAEGLGTFIGALHSINPCEKEFPFVNVPEPAWGEYPDSQNFFMVGDVGTLYVFWDGERVRTLVQGG